MQHVPQRAGSPGNVFVILCPILDTQPYQQHSQCDSEVFGPIAVARAICSGQNICVSRQIIQGRDDA